MLVLVVTTSEPRRFNEMPRSHEWGFSMVIRWVNADIRLDFEAMSKLEEAFVRVGLL